MVVEIVLIKDGRARGKLLCTHLKSTLTPLLSRFHEPSVKATAVDSALDIYERYGLLYLLHNERNTANKLAILGHHVDPPFPCSQVGLH